MAEFWHPTAAEQATRRAHRNGDIPSIVGAAAHARGLRTDDVTELASAVEYLGRGARPLAMASACEDLGRVEAGSGDREAGIVQLTQASLLYEQVGAGWDLARVSRRLRRLGTEISVRPDVGWASLSTSERLVASLIGAGRTNRQVAEQLRVSPHTVNTFLRRVFGKLEIHSRVELARIVAQRG